jgi:hypothetical protein
MKDLIKTRLRYQPFFLFGLPIFFVFHGFVENVHFIRFTDCLLLMGEYCLGALVLYLFFYAFLHHSVKAALMASFVLAFFLFFGQIHDPLRKHAIFLHRYTILLPLFVVVTALLTVWVRKNTPFFRLGLFLTVLFGLYLFVDGVVLIRALLRKDPSGITASSVAIPTRTGCDTCSRPDIYLLLFDEYSGSQTLRDVYHYDNSSLDDFLVSEGFHIQRKSKSNYFMTPFSMASMLNLSFLRGIPNPEALQPDDYTNISEPLKKNEVVNFLIKKGYDIVNISPFDMPEHPSFLDQPFIITKTRLITYNTLSDYLLRDLGYKLGGLMHAGIQDLPNEKALQLTMEASSNHRDRPLFVYMHVEMPHWPYFYDSALHRRSPKEIAAPPTIKGYLDYLPYTNSKVKELITTIKKNTRGQAVILFMSDHGMRSLETRSRMANYFNNQNAVYFPDRDYTAFYDSISNVNQFRVVFNKLFRLNLPILNDSTIFLQDRK